MLRFAPGPALLATLLFTGCATRPLVRSTEVHRIGDTTIESVLFRARGTDLLLLNLHENERTSVDAGIHLIQRRGGQVLTLKHSGERLITFLLGDESHVFDPNRIFTDEGARRTLAQFGADSKEARAEVRHFAADFLGTYRLDRASLIVTLHNNGDNGYSALSYLPGGEFDSDAARVHVNLRRDPDDFFFVTEEIFFEKLRRRGYNVVLQNNRWAADDGSLSVLAARLGIPYINVEAQHGHLKQQRKLLEAVLRLLSQRS